MLTLHGNHLLPQGVQALPEDLARLDQVLSDPGMLAPVRSRFQALAAQMACDPLHRGRPTMPMATYLRLMVARAPHRMGL